MSWSPALTAIKAATVEHFDITVQTFDGHRHNREIYRARMVAVKAASRLTQKSLAQIGRCFGGRDHTTILHAMRRFDAEAAKDDQLLADLEAIVAKVNAGSSYRFNDSLQTLANIIAPMVAEAMATHLEKPLPAPAPQKIIVTKPSVPHELQAAIDAVSDASRRLDDAQFTALERAARKQLEQAAAKLRGCNERHERKKETING